MNWLEERFYNAIAYFCKDLRVTSCWAPRKVRGWKLYELVQAKGQVGYIAGRREKGAFVMKDVATGKKLVEITPRKLVRVARPAQGWMITLQSAQDRTRKEGGASSPS